MNAKRIRQLATVLLAAITLAACAQTPPGKEDPKARLATAEAMFAERCKKAGEFIHRTAENVEGVFLMKLRSPEANHGDQYKMDDPYGKDLRGSGYIETFIRGQFWATHTYGTTKPPVDAPPTPKGYRYVEALDPKDGKRYRYTGSVKESTHTTSILMGGDGKTTFKTKEFVLDKVPALSAMPRYGVTYDDISTREERDYWIAGSSLKVIDLQTNEVMAERIGYMMDRGQGDRSGGRAPWLFAADHACPSFAPRNASTAQPYQTVLFAEKALKPILEE